MEVVASALLAALGTLIMAVLAGFAWMSMGEQEHRAARIALGLSVLGSLLTIGAALFAPTSLKLLVLGIVGAAGVTGGILFLLPIRRAGHFHDIPIKRFDERDMMFARSRLQPGTPEYSSYYQAHPEHKSLDDKMRTLPGLMSMRSLKANVWAFASAEASFSLTEALREEVSGPEAEMRYGMPPKEMTTFVKALARYYGARTVGVADLRPYHVYSHIGRGSGKYGDPIDLPHAYAIALTVEMAFEMMGASPEASTVMESARQYAEAAKIALQLSYLIRYLGYPARAHIDGNYRVIAPLVARDAGLGEIGRMGLLMTPELGPRVRLAVVTTDMPLVPDGRMDGRSMIDFCRICNKCAENCPSRSIPFDDIQAIDGAFRWRIDPDACFHYWNHIGTDCGRCMAVCPYSHPDNLAHRAVRWAVARSGAARRAALWLDDVFYGRKPAMRLMPRWVPAAHEGS